MFAKKISTVVAVFVLSLTTLSVGARDDRNSGKDLPPRPKLIVNIVVGGLSQETLDGFRTGLSGEGFARFAAMGTWFREAHFNYMHTLSAAGIATITTGVNPSMHGVVAPWWIDYVTGSRVSLVDDDSVHGVGGDAGEERYSPLHVIMPTVGDRLLAESPRSKVVSIAVDPVSAIVGGGRSGRAYWMDTQRAVWVSSTAYMTALPAWVVACNTARPANLHIETGWTPARPMRQYINTANTIFGGQGGGERVTSFRRDSAVDYGSMLRSPLGNSLVADFARRVVVGEELGVDDAPDLLNVCFDASRWVGQRFGGSSMEVEDMIYRLDIDLGGFVRAVEMSLGVDNVLFVVTSDHGSGIESVSRGYDRFNAAQFKTILNSFLGVQFGAGDWVLDYVDRQVYLNRNLVYQKNLDLVDVQNRAAAFVLQFRGVSHALTSTALGGGYFGSGYGLKIQNGFYPRRAGDLTLNLMPGWTEDRPGVRSLSGSMYDYDTHVPLIMFGWRIRAGETVEMPVDMTSLAPTLARIMGIGRPVVSDGALLPGFDEISK